MKTRRYCAAILLLVGLDSLAWGQRLEERDVSVFGFNIHYVEAGSGPPVVLLHGLWGGRNEWSQSIGPLSAELRVIVPDMLGFGQSDKPQTNYHMGLMAQFIVGFLDRLEIPKATLIGHAMGATVATYTAVHYPERVERLVLVDGIGYRRDRPIRLPTPAQVRFRRIATGSSVEATKALLKRRVYKDELVTDEWAEKAFQMWLRAAYAIEKLIESGGDVTKEEMRSIKQPTLIVWGEQDELGGPESAEEAHQDIAGSRVAIVGEAGHLPQIDRPEEFNRIVRDYLKAER